MTDRHESPYAPAHGSRMPDAGHGAGPAAGHGHSRSEEDRIHTGKIVGVGVAALVVFFAASLATVSYFNVRVGERTPPPIPKEIGQSKIGMVEQQLFEIALRGENDRKARLQRLGSYGWADREKGVAHMPIEKAMELAARGVRAPAPATGAPAPGGAL